MSRETVQSRDSDYLWDQGDPVDVEVARLEAALSRFKYERHDPMIWFFRITSRIPLRAAAVLAIAILGAWMTALLLNSHTDASSWEITAINGRPTLGTHVLTGDRRLALGQWIETDASSKARVFDAAIGHVTIEPQSRLRVLQSGDKEQRLELARGKIEAFIIAPPRLFFVDTPSATAVDLGCRYNLTVQDDGSGLLEVTLGWVSFERGGQESIVPQGAVCRMRKGAGPGTPHYADASQRLQKELDRFDFEGGGDDAIRAVLAEAGARDTLTLWHLLGRVQGPLRVRIVDQLAADAPPPADISRQSLLNGDQRAVKRWRDAFMWSPPPQTSRIGNTD